MNRERKVKCTIGVAGSIPFVSTGTRSEVTQEIRSLWDESHVVEAHWDGESNVCKYWRPSR